MAVGFVLAESVNLPLEEILGHAPFARIAFANTDLAGAMDHRYSILQAQRAVRQLLNQVLT
jgi:spermidine dehydrogenase